jgi:hypothetical protein
LYARQKETSQTMDDKIENNSSFRKFDQNFKGAKAIKQIAFLLSPFSKTAKGISKSFDGFNEIEKQFNLISKSPDEFNRSFSHLGWIAHESMNHDLMLECIELAKANDIKSAEDKLSDYYTSENLKWLTLQLKGTKEFQKRYELIELAYEDTISKRFHSVVPIVLMIIDGSVNDIDKNKGFFTESTDLIAWDSIAAHSTGLSKLRDIFNKGRNKTNEEEIFLPYRNGILHGRDISYSNKYVAGKCWASLIAINDWAKAIRDGKKNQPQDEKKLTFTESFNDLKKTLVKYQEHKNKISELNNYIDNWKPRNLIIGVDIPNCGSIEDYKEFTPERDAVRFLTNWENKNYGAIAKQINYFTKEFNIGKEAGKVRIVFENKQLKKFEIKTIIDCAPAISEVFVDVQFEFEQHDYEIEIKLRMIYQNKEGGTLVLGQDNGEWKFIESFFFHKIEFPQFSQ